MNILIFGATGGTGRHLVTQGLEKGYHITAFVRNSSILSIQNNNFSLVQGNIVNPNDIKEAIKGQHVVISALGNKTSNALWKSNTIISDGVKNIIKGMQTYKVKRLLFIASFGVNKNIFLPEKLFIRIVLKNIFADIPLQERLIKESGLNWTIFHPARLVNTIKTGDYKLGEQLPIDLFSKISRADMADAIFKNIESDKAFGKILTLSY